MPESTFWSDVDRLTVANHKIIQRDHGTEVLTTDGLLTQLSRSVVQGMESGGAAASFGSRPPIDAGAQDLLLEISGQAREALAAASASRAPIGPAEKHIRLWAAAVNESTMVTVGVRRQYPDQIVDEWKKRKLDRPAVYTELLQLSAWRLVRHWIGRVEGFFFPPDTREIQAPCPMCDERWIYREKDGQTVQSPALMFIREEGEIVEARCFSCGQKWPPPLFEWLAKSIGAKPLPELQPDTSVTTRQGITGL